MAEQETLIYIDEKDLINASITAKNFTKEEVQNRAYYNSLGAELVKKFLASENVDISNIYNIHNINKILEELDISDIMLNNIHIDVRVIFNGNFIFIPKSHFDYEILPDVYLVLLMSNDKKYMNFLGFFEPKLINKNNQNEDFYFIEKEKLTPAKNLKQFIQSFNGNTAQDLATYMIDKADMMMLSMVDHDISDSDKKELLQNLCKSAELRDRFIEFENFELLAFGAQNSPDVEIPTESLPRTLDYAAAATALALKDFNIKNSDPFADSDMTNGFTNIDRDLPELATDNEDFNFQTEELAEVEETPQDEISEEIEPETFSEEIVEQEQEQEQEFTEETPEIVEEIEEIENFGDEVFENETTEEEIEEEEEEEQQQQETIEPNETIEVEEIQETTEQEEVIETEEIKEEETSTIDDFEIVEDETPSENDEDSMLTAAFDETFNMTEGYDPTETIETTEEITYPEITETQADDAQEINSIVEELDAMDLAESGEEQPTQQEESFADFTELEQEEVIQEETETIQNNEEIIPMETISPVEIEISENHEDINETFDLNTIEKVEPSTQNAIVQETIALEDISINHEQPIQEVSMNEPNLELQTFENFQIEENETQTTNTTVETPEQTTEITEETAKIPDISELIGESINNEEQPTGLFIEENQHSTEPATKYEGLLTEIFHKELAPGKFTEYEETPMADLSDFQAEEQVAEETESKNTEDTQTNSELADFSDFASTLEETPTETTEEVAQSNTEELSETFNFEDFQNNTNNDQNASNNENGESIADLDISVNEIGKASLIGGVEYEDGQDISTGELISQIDDLLSSEEAENSSNETSSEVPSEIDLGEFALPDTIKDAEDFTSQDENNYQDDDDDKLGVLFNARGNNKNSNTDEEDEILSEEDIAEYKDANGNANGDKKNMMIIGGALVALLALAGGGFIFWQNKDNLADMLPQQNPNPIENDTPTNLPVTQEEAKSVEANAPDNKELLASTPELDQKVAPAEKTLPPAPKVSGQSTQSAQTTQPAQPVAKKAETTQAKPAEKKQTQTASKPAQTQVAKSTVSQTPITSLSIKKISWEYPDYLSHSNEFARYLQTAGKSIKLKLTSDLLLATEHAYSHKIKVGLQLRNDGTIENAQIIQSSGSNEINDIVLRTVKETLNVVKPAPSEIPTPNFKLALIINI